MSKLDDLIKQYCPDGVEYKRLDSIIRIRNGRDYKAFPAGDIPVYGSGGIMTYINTYAYDKPSVLIPRKGSLGNILYVNNPFWTVDTMFYTEIDSSQIKPRYLYHILLNEHLEEMNQAGGVPSLTQSQLNSLGIPIPPIPVQEEIVHILDSFTKLTAELTAELTARRDQYEYYRDKLLTFDDETAIVKRIKDMLNQTCGGPEKVEYKALGEVCDVMSGGTPPRNKSTYWTGGTVKWLGSSVCQNKKSVDVITGYISEQGLKESSAKIMRKGTTLVALVGATIGKIAFLPFDAAINQNIAGIYPKDTTVLDPSFVYYACTTLYQKFLMLIQGSKLTMANLSFVRGLKIPVPPIQVQQEIVSILYKFNTLTTDISTVLPAEISLRQKQYEHYRDRLLNFNGGGYSMNVNLCYVKKTPLKDVTNVVRGEYITKKEVEEGCIPVILGGQNPAYYINKSNHEGEIVVIARSGASAGFVSYWNRPIFVTDGFGYEAKESTAVTKYLFYVLKNMEKKLNSMKRGAGVPHVSGEALSNVILPIPPIEDQRKIIAILDKFDSLCNDLSDGLPAEIEARKKQYEYYRDKLLDFKEKKA